MKLFSLLCIFLFAGFIAQAQMPSINCDSLLKEFDKEIAQAKKSGTNPKDIEQLEIIKKQFIDTYCNNKTEPTVNKPKTAVGSSSSSRLGRCQTIMARTRRAFSPPLMVPTCCMTWSPLKLKVPR